MEQHYIYADNAATTRMSESALRAMLPWLCERYGNASAPYGLSDAPRRALAEARAAVAAAIGAETDEIYFTSGGTESDNWALRGAAYANLQKGRHLISTAIEHRAVSETLEQLGREGFEVTLLPANRYGRVNPEALRSAIRPDTVLVSVMAANNEVGTLQPIAEIGAICRAAGVLFHTDAVQAVGHIPLDVKTMQIDLLSASAHKFNGPKGCGFLCLRRGTPVQNLLCGGGQEAGRRSGTENIGGICAMAAALSEATERLSEERERLSALRDRLIAGVAALPGAMLTGHPTERLPGLASFRFRGVEGESLVLSLDLAGIAASSGSACSAARPVPSRVLLAMGLSPEEARGSLRLSLGRYSTEEDVDRILAALPPILERLRALSPAEMSPITRLKG